MRFLAMVMITTCQAGSWGCHGMPWLSYKQVDARAGSHCCSVVCTKLFTSFGPLLLNDIL
jgi:hypothetical protein